MDNPMAEVVRLPSPNQPTLTIKAEEEKKLEALRKHQTWMVD